MADPNPRKVLLTGADGQAGWELQRIVRAGVELIACSRAQLDITDGDAVRRAVARVQPDAIINAAAYTAVDRAEGEAATAHAVNREGAAHLARAAAETGARLIHLSTDFVFSGDSSVPYKPSAPAAPLNVYGASKLAGEREVLELAGPLGLVLRTSWLYSAHGSNFVKTMLRLMAAGTALRVVADQQGSPTWAHHLAQVIWRAIDTGYSGVAHFSDAGSTSWYGFACAIQAQALELGLLAEKVELTPIGSHEYPAAARRPAFSALAKDEHLLQAVGLNQAPWQIALRQMLAELATDDGRQP